MTIERAIIVGLLCLFAASANGQSNPYVLPGELSVTIQPRYLLGGGVDDTGITRMLRMDKDGNIYAKCMP